MKKMKFASLAMTAALGISSFSFGAVPAAQNAKAAVPQEAAAPAKYIGSTIDLAIANDERLIEMLKKEGKLANDASPAEAEQALQVYLKAKAEGAKKAKGESVGKTLDAGVLKDKATSNGLQSGKGNKLGQTKKEAVDPVKQEAYNGGVRTDKVLVLAIEYPDYPHSSITKEETDMFYEDYPLSHFQDMIFGKDGYKGPNGQNLVSMKQFYENQSGGSYSVTGNVAGWYTADNPAAYYGQNYPGPDDNDRRARTLVYEALKKAAADPNINLSEYDQWDRDDYDGDGVYAEPDGLIDHLMVIHSGVGEEAGGGKLGGNAIWSHRSKLSTGPVAVPGGHSDSPRWGGVLGAWDYTIEPEDGAAGVFSHEYGHDLGLPDEYDTMYTGTGEPVAYWSIMASGSWAGDLPGTEPSGFSAYAKQQLQAWHGGNWMTGTTVNADDVTSAGTTVLLDEAVTKGTNNDAVRVELPKKVNVVNVPASGKYEYFSGSGDELNNSLVTSLDLTNKTTAELKFKTWYDIEQDWDYGSVQVKEAGSTAWTSIPGNITTTKNPYGQNPGNGITGSSNGWVDGVFNLSAFAGKQIELKFNYWTDVAAAMPGFYVDDIVVTADGAQVLADNADGTPAFTLDGFKKDTGTFLSEQYYLLEWRSHNGVDAGLAHLRRGDSLMSYDSGLLVWYVDDSFSDNWTGAHPGNGFLGVVDADQQAMKWDDGVIASTRYQVRDAAFNFTKQSKMYLEYKAFGMSLKDYQIEPNPLFDDSADYSNARMDDAGRNIPTFGLKFRVVGQSADGTVGKVVIFK